MTKNEKFIMHLSISITMIVVGILSLIASNPVALGIALLSIGLPILIIVMILIK